MIVLSDPHHVSQVVLKCMILGAHLLRLYHWVASWLGLALISGLSTEDARELLKKSEGVKVVDEPEKLSYPCLLQT